MKLEINHYYKFLDKIDTAIADQHLNEQMDDVEHQLLSGEIIPHASEPLISINDDRPDSKPPFNENETLNSSTEVPLAFEPIGGGALTRLSDMQLYTD